MFLIVAGDVWCTGVCIISGTLLHGRQYGGSIASDWGFLHIVGFGGSYNGGLQSMPDIAIVVTCLLVEG